MKNDMLSRVIDFWFNDHYAEMINVLARLVEIKSVSSPPSANEPNGHGPLIALATMAQIMKEYGFEVSNFENSVISADINELEPALAAVAHLDVVEAGDGWNTEPFKLKMQGGKLIGRGVMDDKGPAIAALFAMRAVKDIYPKMSKGFRIVFGSAEETGCHDIEKYAAAHPLPACVFTPDANFPVINIEKGRFTPTFEAAWEKESSPCIVSIKAGSAHNIVPGKAEAVVAGVSFDEIQECCAAVSEETGISFHMANGEKGVIVIAEGVSGHAATPETAENALTALLALLSSLKLPDSPAAAAVKALHDLFPHGDIYGKALGVDESDEKSGALTLSFGVLELDSNGFTANFDCRFPLCTDASKLAATIGSALEKHGMSYTGSPAPVPCHHTPEDSDFVKTLLRVYEDYTGEKGECQAIGGGTYVHGIDGGVAFGCEMPGSDHFIHGANEWISLDELITSAKMFTRVICDMCV